MANKCIARCPISIVVREIQIKTTLKDFKLTILANILMCDSIKCWQGCEVPGTLTYIKK